MRLQNIQTKKLTRITGISIYILILSSCIATNNMYVNNPEPLDKYDAEGYIAISTGLEAKLDSSLINGKYVTDYKTSLAPVFSIGGQIGLGKNFNVRLACHLP